MTKEIQTMSRFMLLFLCLAHWPAQTTFGQGRFEKLELDSRFLKTARTARIYLPPSYTQPPNLSYPVLYLHDGQNLFSSAGTNICFGWGNWELDKTTDKLSQ